MFGFWHERFGNIHYHIYYDFHKKIDIVVLYTRNVPAFGIEYARGVNDNI